MNLILFLAAVFLITFVLGILLEKIRIPWIFSALLIGLGLAAYNPFTEITSSAPFTLMAQLGMYFLLFIIGFEINLEEIRRKKGFIVRTTLAIIFAEALIGTFFVHYVFGASWFISVLVALSFATVGEAVLLPILDEFKLTKTPLGQTILGIGVLDDVIEVATIIVLTVLLGVTIGHAQTTVWGTLAVLLLLFGLAYLFTHLKDKAGKIHFKGVALFFLFVVFFIFAFVGIGLLAEAAALGALLAGMALRNFIPAKKWKLIDSEIRTMAYGFFAPIFFLWVGLDLNIDFLIRMPLLILALVVLITAVKVATSYFLGRKLFGTKPSLIMGLGLTVKLSTSIVIIKLLFERGLISGELYSILVGSTILFMFIVPFLLSTLIRRWNIAG